MSAQPSNDPRYQPMKPQDAKLLARSIVETGMVEVSAHAETEMANDDLQVTDCINMLRAGVFGGPEPHDNEIRYRVETARMCVVITFRSADRVRIVTAWRKRGK